MLFADIARTSATLAGTASRLEKVARLSDCLRRLAPAETAIGVAYLTGSLPQGKIGIGPATLRKVSSASAAERPVLAVGDVHDALNRIAAISGSGSTGRRERALTQLLGRSTCEEQRFLMRLLAGELRQGALEGVMAEAIATAYSLPAADVRRAAMLAGELSAVAEAAMRDGAVGLDRFRLQVGAPVQPMLALPAEDIDDALARLGGACMLEYKLDGARVQIHKSGDEVQVYTRRLNDVSATLPEVTGMVAALPAQTLILDGECIALRADGRPHPFQITMRRFGRRLDVARMRDALPLSVFLFDCLHFDGEDLIDRGTVERQRYLERLNAPLMLVQRLSGAGPAEAEAFLQGALGAGHEGVMAKALDAPYEAGRRGASWLKVKPTHTLDLVVLAVEWGSGRRRGKLSNLHLGALEEATGEYVMLGKTFKGLTDELLAWQTQKLLELEISRDAQTVYVRPELVVEIAFNNVQRSSRYPGGLALRFARVKRYRPDKSARAADTMSAVRALAEPPVA